MCVLVCVSSYIYVRWHYMCFPSNFQILVFVLPPSFVCFCALQFSTLSVVNVGTKYSDILVIQMILCTVETQSNHNNNKKTCLYMFNRNYTCTYIYIYKIAFEIFTMEQSWFNTFDEKLFFETYWTLDQLHTLTLTFHRFTLK